MNKRGDITDIPFAVILLGILAIGFFVIIFIVPQLTEGLRVGGINSTVEGESAIVALEDFATTSIQRGFFFLTIGIWLGVLLSAFFIRTHPIFVFLYVIFLGISLLIGTFVGNMYAIFSQETIFAEVLATQTLINLVMNNLLKITLGFGTLSIIIIFSKFSSLIGGNRL